MLLDDPVEAFEIEAGEVALPEEARSEPVLVSGPYLVEFDEVAPLDPARGVYEPEEIEEYPEPPHHPKPAGLAGSLGMHLLPLLFLLALTSSTPAESGGVIPVQLVLQQAATETPTAETDAPQAEPPQAEQAPQPPPPIPPVTPPKPAEPKPKVRQAAVAPPQPPQPAAPTPASAPRAVAKLRDDVQLASAATTMRQIDPLPRPIQQAAAPAGLNATGPYLAFLVNLTRQHLDMLPANVVGGRRGKTVIGVRVMDDGTIMKTRVAASSSYPDIDARIEQMVVAVGHFPPLPTALRGQNIELDLNLNFPEVFQQ